MYHLSRLMLMIAVAAGAYCIALVAIAAWPLSGLVAVIILGVHVTNRRRRGQLTTLGSARWANENDLRRAGMLGADSGLILGRLPQVQSKARADIRKLFARRIDAEEACQQFWLSQRRGRDQLVRLSNAIHTAVFSPSGGGKGVSCVIPFLLTCPESCVVIDFKGENAQRTADHRRKRFGNRIVMLDPFKVVAQTPDCFNPLDFIDKQSSTAIDECNDLAKALVVRTGEEREKHFDDAAEMFISAVLATIVQYGGEETRSLQTARDILSHTQKLDMAIKLMCESECWDGMLARMGGQLTYFVEKEKSSVLTTVGRHLRFLDSLAVADSTRSSSFDPSELRSGKTKTTAFLILPMDRTQVLSPLLRVWIGSLLRAVVKEGLQE